LSPLLTGCPQPLTIEAGHDFYTTVSTQTKDIPQQQVFINTTILEIEQNTSSELGVDFFGPGSDPFFGQIPLEGWPLISSPVCTGNIGLTDTIVERLEDAELDRVPSQVTIDVQLVELSLQSVEPIIVTYNGGNDPEMWDVFVTHEPDSLSPGQMTVKRNARDGGVFDAQIPVIPRLQFFRTGDSAMREKTLESQTLMIRCAPWTTDTNHGQLPDCAGNFVPVLHRIPILNNLFRNGSRAESQNLLILIKPTIIVEKE